MEEQAKSCELEADKKAKEALTKHKFNLLAQSVALREKAKAACQSEIATQRKTVQKLESSLV